MKIILLLVFFILGLSLSAQELVNPRNFINIQECNIFFTPHRPQAVIPFDDSTGIKLANSKTHKEFQDQARILVEKYGEESFYKSRLTITGIDMMDSKNIRNKYLGLLQDIGLNSKKIDLRVMDYPFEKVVDLSRKSLQAAINKIKYHTLPNKVRHFQKVYFKQKTLPSLKTTAFVESLGVTLTAINPYMNSVEKSTLIMTNITLFYLYAKYKDSWLNWLFNPGSGTATGVVKQSLMSVPFITAFMLFGNLNVISEYMVQYGLIESVKELVQNQLWNIAKGAAPTTFLTTIWHRFFNTDILAGWYNSKKTMSPQEQLKAFRTMENIIKPTGFLFSALFAVAANPKVEKILQLGVLGEYNIGHIGMATFTAIMIATFKANPKLLDKINNSPNPLKLMKMWRDNIRKSL